MDQQVNLDHRVVLILMFFLNPKNAFMGVCVFLSPFEDICNALLLYCPGMLLVKQTNKIQYIKG